MVVWLYGAQGLLTQKQKGILMQLKPLEILTITTKITIPNIFCYL